jgi:hypothetical protein
MRRKRRDLHELPLRTSRYGERCLVCLERIEAGSRYHDGAYGRRAHPQCAAQVRLGQRREPTRAEIRQLEEAEVAVSKAQGRLYQAGKRDGGGPETRLAASLAVAAEERVERLREGWAAVEAPE